MRVVALRNREATAHANADLVLSFASGGMDAVSQVVEQSDLLVLALPQTGSTGQLVEQRMIDKLRPNAVVVNVGRGSALDEAALASRLLETAAAGDRGVCAALDVFSQEPLPVESQLWSVPVNRLLLSPHTMDQTRCYWERALRVWETNAQLFLENGADCHHIGPLVDLDLEY